LLVLLLVVLGGIGFYYFVGVPEVQQPAPRVEKKAIVVPPKPEPVPEKKTVAADKTTQPPRAEKAPQPKAAETALPSTPKDDKGVSSEPSVAENSSAATDGAAEKPTAAPAPAQPEVATVPTGTEQAGAATEPAPEPTAEPAAARGRYTVQAGALLLKASEEELETALRQLGFEPQVEPVEAEMEMTRLRVGSYPVAEARARVAELKSEEPGAFLVIDGDQGTVYAGSYRILDKARREADLLYARGLRVEEEPVSVPMTLHRVYFGPFAERDQAAAAAAKAREAGLEALVLERP
jgi:cell division septation protein DedD